MQIQPSTRNSRFVDTAISDDGRVSYSPIGNDRLIDLTTGRDMWRGLYPDADGFFTTERVPAGSLEDCLRIDDRSGRPQRPYPRRDAGSRVRP